MTLVLIFIINNFIGLQFRAGRYKIPAQQQALYVSSNYEMTLQQFQKQVLKANWYDKYFYYLLSITAIIVGLFFLYDVITHQTKYDKLGTRYLGYLVFLFFTIFGLGGFYFTQKRYKVITFNSELSINTKEKLIIEIIKEFGDPYYEIDNEFYRFRYHQAWWKSDYKIYLSFDDTNFYGSVQSTVIGYPGGGIIDFGGTEKVRQKLISSLTNLLHRS